MLDSNPPNKSSLAPAEQQWIRNSLALIAIVFATGCHIPGLCFESFKPTYYKPCDNLPDDFNGMTCSGESSAHLSVGEFFDDPVLTQLIYEGLASNQELAVLNQEVAIASNETLSRRGEYLPFVTVGAEGGFERTSKFTPLGAAEEQLTFPGGGEFPDPLTNVKLSADLFWHIDIWRELRNARDAAMQRYIKAAEDRDYFVTQLVAEISENYYELAALDQELVYLNQTVEIQNQSLEVAKAQKEAARGTELPVQRFLAEVRKNESQRLIVQQEIVEAENRINFLVGRYPQRVARTTWDFVKLDSRILCVGVPADLLRNRRDIQAAERELAASGLDVLVARARFYPRLEIGAGIGFEAFDPKYLVDPQALIANTVGEIAAPLINKRAIRAEYYSANARQMQAVFDYQRTILNAYTEVVNRMAKVENYRQSVQLKQAQVAALETSVNVANDLFQNARSEYIDVLFSQRDLLEARTELIETKQQQLAAIVTAYQALGGGYLLTTSGMTYADLFCNDCAVEPHAVLLPPTPADVVPIPTDAVEEVPIPDNGGPQLLPLDDPT